MRPYMAVSALGLVLCAVPLAQAQVTIDATKITCDQFVHSKVGALRVTAAWLSGFYHGKHNKRTVDPQKFEQNLSKLEKFCYEEKNFKLPVMQAVQRVIGAAK